MKKLLLLIACVSLFFGCNKDNARNEQTILLHLQDSDGVLITLKPENTAVFIFEDNGKEVDYKKSSPSIDDGKLTYADGTKSSKAKFFDGGSAVYTFKNVPNGAYILFVHYFPYSVGVRSAKKLIVNENSNLKIETKSFKSSSGYEEW